MIYTLIYTILKIINNMKKFNQFLKDEKKMDENLNSDYNKLVTELREVCKRFEPLLDINKIKEAIDDVSEIYTSNIKLYNPFYPETNENRISVKLTYDNLDLMDFHEMDLEDIEELCMNIKSMEDGEAMKVFAHYEPEMDESMDDLDTWEDFSYDNVQEYICDMVYQTWERENGM